MGKRSRPSPLTHGLLGAILALTGIVWFMHGPVLFTTPPRPAQSVDPLDELFAPTGLGDELGSVRTIDRRFRLGLLPSGWGIGAVSVSTIAPPLIVGMLLSSRRRPSAFARPDRSRPPAYPKADDQ